jgi:hypothetical protein
LAINYSIMQWHFEKLKHIEIIIFNFQTYKINEKKKLEHLHEPHKSIYILKLQKKLRNQINPYLIFTCMFKFLGFNPKSTQVLSHVCMPLPKFFGPCNTFLDGTLNNFYKCVVQTNRQIFIYNNKLTFFWKCMPKTWAIKWL